MLLPDNLVPSLRTDGQAPFPSVGQSQPNQAVEVSFSHEREEVDPEAEANQAILDEAHERFQATELYEQWWRRRAREELDFCDALKHWTDEQREERRGLPCLEFDKIGPAVAQVVNDARQNPPEAKISPNGGKADKFTAEVIQGLIRNIDQDSDSSIAKMTGYEHAVKIGRGWWRVDFEYENDSLDWDEVAGDPEAAALAFQQKIVIRRIANPFSVYPDPAAEEYDYSDMKYCFVTEDVDRASFEDQYPDAQSNAGNFAGLSDLQRDEWFPKGAVRVAEYWRIVTTTMEIAQLPDGRVMPIDQVPEGVNIINRRKVRKKQVRCAKITGAEVLSDTAWPGKWIPLIPCLGREIIFEGKRRLAGMVRPAMDANLSYDYMRSRQVQAVGLGAIAPYLVAEGSIEGHENEWNAANRKPLPYLLYKVTDGNGQQLPEPKRNQYEPAIQAITVATQFAADDCKSTLSTYDESLGKQGPAQSGIAVNLRQREADNAHFNYHDNLARSVRHTARVELDLIPHIYSEARMVTLFDPDGSVRQEWVNQATTAKDGIERIYRMESAARCDVVMGDGPSYATRRQQGAAALMQLVQSIPEPMTRALDLLVKAMDIPDGDKLAERLRPPDIQAEQDGEQPTIQQLQQVLAQFQQQNAMLTQHVNELSETIRTDQVKTQSAERMNLVNNIVKLLSSEALSKGQIAQLLLEQDHKTFMAAIERAATVADAEGGAAASGPADKQNGGNAKPYSGEPAAPSEPGQDAGGQVPPPGHTTVKSHFRRLAAAPPPEGGDQPVQQ